MQLNEYTFDCETYINYFEVKFYSISTGKIYSASMHNDGELNGDFESLLQLKQFIQSRKRQFIGFNSNGYDNLVLTAFIQGKPNKVMKAISDDIIVNRVPWWNIYDRYNLERNIMDRVKTIDICQPAPSVQTSLKLYGGRLGFETMQDLPIDPSEVINDEQAVALSDYCDNDLRLTTVLYNMIKPAIELREELTKKYGVNLRSKSDPQMAEAIFKVYLTNQGVTVKKRQTSVEPFRYRVPEWVKFESKELKDALERVKQAEFTVSDKGVLQIPDILKEVINFDGKSYTFAGGGLHSQEENQCVVPKPNQLYGEFDIASLYPSIIIEQELYPLHIGKEFLDVYTSIRDSRMAAKARIAEIKALPNRDDYQDELDKLEITQASNKLSLNGSYGKFGSVYSYLYSPELLAQTTITGQLFLLMSIERVVREGGEVMSANTDGINVLYDKCDKDAIANAISSCELDTGYVYEYTPYAATYSRNVNNYIAVKPDGKVKRKGCFAESSLMKNPANQVVFDAITEYVSRGTSIEEHIKNETDITKFCVVRTVTGGAMYEDEEVGKVCRFYHSKTGKELNYKKNGNLVPTSTGCRPLMDLSTFIGFEDVDHQWYIDEAYKVMNVSGVS